MEISLILPGNIIYFHGIIYYYLLFTRLNFEFKIEEVLLSFQTDILQPDHVKVCCSSSVEPIDFLLDNASFQKEAREIRCLLVNLGKRLVHSDNFLFI